MKILHVIAQKPQDTGSGVYAKNLINKMGSYEQALVAGIDVDDNIDMEVEFYPVVFRSGDLDFPIVGMSDSMPYESTMYKKLVGRKLEIWRSTFKEKLEEVKKEFKPDVIISHHLYLLTSIVREVFREKKVIGVCHATDMRQLMSHDLEIDYIKKEISNLDRIFVLHGEQRKQIEEFFSVESNKVEVVGLGYDENLFTYHPEKQNNKQRNKKENKEDNQEVVKEIWYVGKVAKAKGVEELLDSYSGVKLKEKPFLKIAGGISGAEGRELSNKAKNTGNVDLLGKIDQRVLANKMKKGHILVLPSYYEGFPMVVIEALACGMKVVVNDIPGLKEALGPKIIKSGRIHFLSMPILEEIDKIHADHRIEYVKTLTNKLEEVILEKDSDHRLDLKKFTWDGIVKKYMEVIQTI